MQVVILMKFLNSPNGESPKSMFQFVRENNHSTGTQLLVLVRMSTSLYEHATWNSSRRQKNYDKNHQSSIFFHFGEK